MIFSWFVLFIALCLSAVAAYYSIVGLAAIFAAAVLPIVVMGGILEVAKITVTVWLHQYWSHVQWLMRTYLVIAVASLMLLTSMGIFGFLSKAHTDQALVSGDVSASLAIVDEKIKIQRENIANSQAVIRQMDATVDGIIAQGDQEIRLRDGTTRIQSAAERALQVRRSQARDRNRLIKDIETAQAQIIKLQEESAPARAEFRKVEAEVGPIKYIAALIYGDNPDTNLLERAVRWVIIIIVAVFDPLAIMMVLAATESMKWHSNGTVASGAFWRRAEPKPKPEPEPESKPEPEPESKPEPELGPRPAQVIDYQILDDYSDDVEPVSNSDSDLMERPGDYVTPRENFHNYTDDYVDYNGKRYRTQALKSLNPELFVPPTDVGYGREFPKAPTRGDQWIRVDTVPTKVYKFNGDAWIEVDKNITSAYSYDDNYISYLIDRISAGEYDPELLSTGEREQIEQRLKRDLS